MANSVEGTGIIQQVLGIISSQDAPHAISGTRGQGEHRDTTQHRFHGILPAMIEARGMRIFGVRSLSILEMVQRRILNEDILNVLKPSFRYGYIINQGADGGYMQFAYHADYPAVPDSAGGSLREQMASADNHCRAVMDGVVGITPGLHNLRDTLNFVLAYRVAHGKYPIREAGAFRTFDLLGVDNIGEYHPTVWLYTEEGREKIAVERTRADHRDFGTVAPLIWKPSW